MTNETTKQKNDMLVSELRADFANALNTALEVFSASGEGSFEDTMSSGLMPLATVTGFDRVAVYSYSGMGNNKYLGQIFSWRKDESGKVSLTEGLTILPNNAVVKNWLTSLKKNEHVVKHWESMSKEEKRFMETFGVRSIMLVPVFLYGKFWGAVTFQDSKEGLDFTESCVDFLRSSAYLCATAIIREEKTRSADQATETLEQRERMLNALNEMDIMLLSHNSGKFDDVMSSSLSPIVEAAGLDRIVIYRIIDIDMNKRFGQIYRWDKSEGGLISVDDFLRILPNIPVIDNWLGILLNSGVINTYLSAADEDEAAFLDANGIKSYLLIPVFIDNKPWGGIAFQDHTNERFFDPDCIGFLSSAARLCANAIIRNENYQSLMRTAETLKYREKMLDTLNETAIMFLSQHMESFEDMMTGGLGLIADVFDLDRISIWRNSIMPDGLRVSQIYRWDKDAGGTTLPAPGMENITYAEFAPRWEELLKNDETINSPVSLLPEAAILKSFGVVSAFVAPIFMNNTFWGFVLFEDRVVMRYFNEHSAEMMRSAAFLCANTVVMNERTNGLKYTTEMLKRREKMLGAINEMAIVLISHEKETLEDVLSMGLKPISGAAGVDRVAVYKMLNKDIQLGQVYLWHGETLPLEDKLFVVPQDPPVVRWLEVLTKGDCINANVNEVPDDEAAWLSRYGAKAVYFVPIFKYGKFWGVITLEDHSNYRYFDEDSLDLLQSAAHLCADVVVRADMVRETAERNKMLSALNSVSSAMLQSDVGSFDSTLHESMNVLAGAVDIDRICIWKNNSTDGLAHSSVVYEWNVNKTNGKKKEKTINVPFGEIVPGKEDLLLQGETIVSLVRDMPEGIKERLSPRGVLSVMMIPVFLHNRFWGFISFEDCRNERIFSQNEETIMHSAVHLWAGAIVRAEMENEIQLLGIEAGKVYYDPLTSIYNRRFFDENLASVIKTLSRSNGLLSLMMIDVDLFKEFNDTYGHNEGDKCLKAIAKTISKNVTRENDFVARYGGEEFVVVLPHTDEKGARLLADKLLKRVRASKILHEKNVATGFVTISIGVVTGIVRHMQTGDDYVRHADEMLYVSKQSGRDRYTFEIHGNM